ncbi:MAG: signal peptidase I [Candidatus Pacearchaeota archaeon]
MKKKDNNILDFIKKAWDYLWNGESFLSWILFLIFVFIFIKFIFFPVLSFIFGSSLPIVIVESCSMYHDKNFNEWWDENGDWYEKNGIKKSDFENFPLRDGFNKGDIFFVSGIKKELKTGEVIIFSSGNSKRPIIHRIVGLNPLNTKGDNNPDQIPFEKDINKKDIIGKAVNLRIPFIGWIKLIFFEPLKYENERGFCK